MTMAPAVPQLAPLFDVVVELGSPHDLGVTRVGHRRIVPILGGTITGAVDAQILPGGADWQRLRADGAIEIDGRYSARTAQGEHLYLQVNGVRSGAPSVLAALGRGEEVSPMEYYFRTSVTVETSSPGLTYLQDTLLVASCVREHSSVRYTAYRVA
ncbi:DUF3237 domain-containing protein [Microbacterium sp. ISL-103]|uniref:DUF3237 domain-containing protein n=1 Tax=Microbacterium sp. ISL-103 TaxID=2819156 RepID=UPI001BE857D7|nr:DUF3237 domain-containing protein [Microbacterium sp. ISL-103]MBT2474929.1 DUF3237 domain-containing protein [Microbacterium sp. ISL-103]